MEPRKRKRDAQHPRITYLAPTRTFERLLKERSLDATKDVVRQKLGLHVGSVVELVQIRDGKTIDLEDDDDFEAFMAYAQSNGSVEVRASLPTGASATASSIQPSVTFQNNDGQGATSFKRQKTAHTIEPSSSTTPPDPSFTTPDPKRKTKRNKGHKKSGIDGQGVGSESPDPSHQLTALFEPQSPTRQVSTVIPAKPPAESQTNDQPASPKKSNNLADSATTAETSTTSVPTGHQKRKRSKTVTETDTNVPENLTSTTADAVVAMLNGIGTKRKKKKTPAEAPPDRGDVDLSGNGVELDPKTQDKHHSVETTASDTALPAKAKSKSKKSAQVFIVDQPKNLAANEGLSAETSPKKKRKSKNASADPELPAKDAESNYHAVFPNADSSGSAHLLPITDSSKSTEKSSKKDKKRKKSERLESAAEAEAPGEVINPPGAATAPTADDPSDDIHSALDAILNKPRTPADVLSLWSGYNAESVSLGTKSKKAAKSKLSQSWVPPAKPLDAPSDAHKPSDGSIPVAPLTTPVQSTPLAKITATPVVSGGPLVPTPSPAVMKPKTIGCHICEKPRKHARRTCMVVKAGSAAIDARVEELRKGGQHPELVEELVGLADACRTKEAAKQRTAQKTEAKMVKVAPTKAGRDMERQGGGYEAEESEESSSPTLLNVPASKGKAGSSSSATLAASLSQVPTAPSSSHCSDTDGTSGETDSESSESSEEEEKEEEGSKDSPCANALESPLGIDGNMDDIDMASLIRGPMTSFSKDDIPSSESEEGDEDHSDDVVLEEDKEEGLPRRRKPFEVPPYGWSNSKSSSENEAEDSDADEGQKPMPAGSRTVSQEPDEDIGGTFSQAVPEPISSYRCEAIAGEEVIPLQEAQNDPHADEGGAVGDEKYEEGRGRVDTEESSHDDSENEDDDADGQDEQQVEDDDAHGSPPSPLLIPDSQDVMDADHVNEATEGSPADSSGSSIKPSEVSGDEISEPSSVDLVQGELQDNSFMLSNSSSAEVALQLDVIPQGHEKMHSGHHGEATILRTELTPPRPSTPPLPLVNHKPATPGTIGRMKDRLGRVPPSPQPVQPATSQPVSPSPNKPELRQRAKPAVQANVSTVKRRSTRLVVSKPVKTQSSNQAAPTGRPPRHTLVTAAQTQRRLEGAAVIVEAPEAATPVRAGDKILVPSSSAPALAWTTLSAGPSSSPMSLIGSRASSDQDNERAEVDELVSETGRASQDATKGKRGNVVRKALPPKHTTAAPVAGQKKPRAALPPASDGELERQPAAAAVDKPSGGIRSDSPAESESSPDELQPGVATPTLLPPRFNKVSLTPFRSLTDIASQENLFTSASIPKPMNFPAGPLQRFMKQSPARTAEEDEDEEDSSSSDDSDQDSKSAIPKERRAGVTATRKRSLGLLSR